MYVNEMAAEIRVLEDQLYRADYDNRMLREKLARLEEGTPLGKSDSVLSPSAAPKARPKSPPPGSSGSPTSPNQTPKRTDSGQPKSTVPGTTSPKPGKSGNGTQELEPPSIRLGTPKEADDPKDVVPGDLVPPALNFGTPEAPKSILPPSDTNDKIKLPGSAQRLLDEPAGPIEEIRLDPAMTKTFLENGESGLTVVFIAMDADGRPAAPDCDVDISLVDPSLVPEKARLGRWTVPADEVKKSTSADKVVRLKVYWEKEGPASHQAQVHVRLLREDGKMTATNQIVSLGGNGTSADWSPRTSRVPSRSSLSRPTK
jgi:hypothetical protein